ncbi:hypothetical protein PLIIFM63780_008885 [Purpureocillium lilacinum]|uniref:Uncharacterized protein n=1 Tax=Purpureocillium lilacinum TaxID=33203 RepID=A0A2U3E8J3_PURLI|nr:hypothetical protein PCL_12198 [Purpureocillium lilacinum]GJN85318.1 hypothetical protein PLIIFM63780_008885 [Purpureocillium lilacinum]
MKTVIDLTGKKVREIIDLTGDDTDENDASEKETVIENRAAIASPPKSPVGEHGVEHTEQATVADHTNGVVNTVNGDSEENEADVEAHLNSEANDDEGMTRDNINQSREQSLANEAEVGTDGDTDHNANGSVDADNNTKGNVDADNNTGADIQADGKRSLSRSPGGGVEVDTDAGTDHDDDTFVDAENGTCASSSPTADNKVDTLCGADNNDGSSDTENDIQVRMKYRRGGLPSDDDEDSDASATMHGSDDDHVSVDSESFIGPKWRGHKRKRSSEEPSPENSGRDKRVRTEEFRLAACLPGMFDGRLTQENYTPGFDPLAPVSGETPPRKSKVKRAGKAGSGSPQSQKSANEPSEDV